MKSKSPAVDDDTMANEVQATVKLATAALDHGDVSDEELDRLCETAFSECPNPTIKPSKPKK